jgi:phytoene dehydrogenase-like protein
VSTFLSIRSGAGAPDLESLIGHLGRLDIIEVIASQPTPEDRHDFAQMWYGSTMDTVRRFLAPDQGRCIQGSLAAMSIDAFDGGPWIPGSNASTLYHYLIGGGNVEYIMPRGGIGSLSTALCRRAESLGAVVQMKQYVKEILVDNGRATESNYATAQRFRLTRCCRRSTLTPRS